MNALPAHPPLQSVVRVLSDGSETGAGTVPGPGDSVSTAERVRLVVRLLSQQAANDNLSDTHGGCLPRLAMEEEKGRRWRRRQDLQGVTAGTVSESALGGKKS